MRQTFGLDDGLAKPAVDMLMALTGQAGRRVARGQMSVDEAEVMVCTLILGALKALAEKAKASA